MLNNEQFLAASKSNVEDFFGLTNKAFAGVEKLVELNLQTTRTAIAEAAAGATAVISAKDAQEFLALQSGLLQPTTDKAAAYARHVADITTATTAEFKKASEATAAQLQAKFLEAVETAMKSAPVGNENAAAFMKSAVTAANDAFTGVQKAVKQATETAEANFQVISDGAAKATKTKRTA